MRVPARTASNDNRCWFYSLQDSPVGLAWGQPTFYDSLARLDRDNGVAFDIFTVDGNNPRRVGFGGGHLGTNGAPSNLFAGAVVGVGRRVQFRLSTFHLSDLEAYGVGCLLVLDR